MLVHTSAMIGFRTTATARAWALARARAGGGVTRGHVRAFLVTTAGRIGRFPAKFASEPGASWERPEALVLTGLGDRSPMACRRLTGGSAAWNDESLNKYTRERLDEFMETCYDAKSDTAAKRARVLRVVQYLQDELGATRELAWYYILRLKRNTARSFINTPVETMDGVVSFLRKEGGWDNETLFKVLWKYPFFFQCGRFAQKVEQLEDGLGVSRVQALMMMQRYCNLVSRRDLDKVLDFLQVTVGIPRENLLATPSIIGSRSLERNMKPRFYFVKIMEQTNGCELRLQPQSYWSYSDKEFEELIELAYGIEARQRYREFHSEYLNSSRPKITDESLSEDMRKALDEFTKRTYSFGHDSLDLRDRVRGHILYFQSEFGVAADEALSALGSPSKSKMLVATPLATIQETVKYLKEGGWSNAEIWNALHKYPDVVLARKERLELKVQQLKEELGLRDPDAMWILKMFPAVVTCKDLGKKLKFLIDTVKVPRERVLKSPQIIGTRSLEQNMKPRFYFVQEIERKTGKSINIQPNRYWRYPEAKFKAKLDKTFGVGTGEKYTEYYLAAFLPRGRNQ